jgi:hypothetical protein
MAPPFSGCCAWARPQAHERKAAADPASPTNPRRLNEGYLKAMAMIRAVDLPSRQSSANVIVPLGLGEPVSVVPNPH